MTYFSISLIPLWNGGDREVDRINMALHDYFTISLIPKIMAKSDSDNITISHSILDEVHKNPLEKTVRDLSSFHTRHTESELIDDVAYWLTEKLQSTCSRDVYIHNFTYILDKDGNTDSKQQQQQQRQEKMPLYHLKNLVCEKPGSTNNTIMISAHYDSRMEDINNSTARAPGADDNASGVSALLEVARVLSNVSLNHSVIFVLFSGEEQGKWGSTHYADLIDTTDVDLNLLINLDMVGFALERTNDFLIEYDNGKVVQDNDKSSRAVASFIKKVADKYTNLNATLGLLGNSDYLPFEALGYTVIGFHDNGVTNNPNHHKSTDTPDILNYEYLTSVTKLILATILSLDKDK
ncbi:MAG: M20/M25/M40 family metallo-hydrolase [Nitrososphaeraceae archaeon]